MLEGFVAVVAMDVLETKWLATGLTVTKPASVVVEMAAQGMLALLEQFVVRAGVQGALAPPETPVVLQSVVFAAAATEPLLMRKALLLYVLPVVLVKPEATKYW